MSTELTNQNALERFLSTQGVISYSEHDSQGPEGAIVQDCVSFGIALFVGRLAHKYKKEALERSALSREICTVIAARTLCNRRGNPIPESLEMRYQELLERNGLIDQIAKGIVRLVDDDGNLIGGRGANQPTMSNLVIDRRYVNEKVRVRRGSSTNTNSTQERDFLSDYGRVVDGF